jgi:hypothetical protein
MSPSLVQSVSTSPPDPPLFLVAVLAVALVVIVLFVLIRVSRWRDLAAQFGAGPHEGDRGVLFRYVILRVNGVNIPSRIVVSASGLRLSPRGVGALLYDEVFLPWRDVRVDSAHGRTYLHPARQPTVIVIRSGRASDAVCEAFNRQPAVGKSLSEDGGATHKSR